MIPQQSAELASLFHPSLLPGHKAILEYWHQHTEATRRALLALKILDDLPDKESLDETLRCVEIMHEMADLATSLGPQAVSTPRRAAPLLALLHLDYAVT